MKGAYARARVNCKNIMNIFHKKTRKLPENHHLCQVVWGFAAAALQLAARDKWIGWDAERRRGYLHTVVGMRIASSLLSTPGDQA